MLAALAASCVLDPSLPENLTVHATVQPLCAGYLNVSAPPYSAAGDGTTDDSTALQAALDDAYSFRLAVLLPAGRIFLISRQLRAVQDGKPVVMREFGYQLVGEVSRAGVAAPVLRVVDGADPAVFPSVWTHTDSRSNKTYEARPMLLYDLINDMPSPSPPSNQSSPPSLYSALLRHVDIDMGTNPALSAVAMSGAQLCSIEDVRIYGAAFTAGVVGLPGSGGYSANLAVSGGGFGVWQQQFRPNPSASGFTALNQSVAAVLLTSARGPLVLSGFVLRSALPGAVGVLMDGAADGLAPGDASLALEDGVIELAGGGSGGSDDDAAAIAAAITGSSGSDVSLRNVWLKCAVAVALPKQRVAADPASFKRITAWSWGGGVAPRRSSVAYVNGSNASAATVSTGFPPLNGLPSAPAATPPPDAVLATMHSWSRAAVAPLSWSADAGVVLDVVRDCGATPSWVNASDDDGAAIARCLARATARGVRAVFVPRGEFLLWETLVLRAGQRLFGAGKHCAALVMRQPWPATEQPLLLVEGSDTTLDAVAVVSDLVLVVVQRAPVLAVRGAALVRDLRTTPCAHNYETMSRVPCPAHTPPLPPPFTAPAVAAVIFESGNASGHFFGLSLDHFSSFLVPGDALINVSSSGGGGRGRIAGTGGPGGSDIHLYQLSAEHLPTDYQVQVWRSAGVHLHAFKFESAGFRAHPSWGPDGGGLFACHGSSGVSIFGGSGNFGVMNASLANNIIFSWGCDGMQLDAVVRKPLTGETPPSVANWVRSTTISGMKLQIDDSNPSLLTYSPPRAVVK